MATKNGMIRTPIWNDKLKRWKLDVQVNGKRKSFYSSTPGRAGAKECIKRAESWESGFAPDGETRIKDICDAFIEHLQQQRTPSSAHWRQHNSNCKNWIKPFIGMRRISTIQDIEPLQEILYAAYDKGLCKRSIKNIRSSIIAVFKYARIRRATHFVPEGLTVPRYARTKGRAALRVNDIVTLMTSDRRIKKGKETKELFVNAWRFEAIMGFRPGEVFGLKHENIEGNLLTITKTINSLNEQTQGKNENALRHAILPPIALEVLDRQKALLQEFGIESEYVFPNEDGGPIKQITARTRWYKYRDLHGMEPKATPYSLRNTAISAYKAIPKPMLDPVVGHSEDMDTFGVYGRELDGDLDLVAEAMQSAFTAIMDRASKKP